MDAAPSANLPLIVAGLSFVLAFVFGAVANRVNFCTMGAISDVVNFGDWRRMRMWVLAIAVAITGSAVLVQLGLIDLSKSLYTGARVAWVSAIVGGFLFGFGMTLASGCGSKTLIRAGAGNLKSLLVLVVFAVAASMTLRGLFAVWRDAALDPWRIDFSAIAPTSDLPTLLGAIGLGATAKVWLPFAVALGLLIYVFKDREFRVSKELIIGGIIIGLVIVGGWYITGNIGYLAEDPATLEEKFVATNTNRIESYSFTAPIAFSLELLLLWSDASRIVTFGIAGVAGMLTGSAAYALASRTFRWEGFGSVEDVGNHIVGAIFMGFGGVTALGCTIGQGLTGISTLAVGSVIALASIIVGSVAAQRYLMGRMENRGGAWKRWLNRVSGAKR